MAARLSWTAALVLLSASCAASCAIGAAAERQQEDARLQDQLVKVQEAACVRPPSAPSCAGDLRVSFEKPNHGRVEIWCAENGWAHVKGAHVDGPLPLSIWSALERVVLAADGCVIAYGERVSISTKRLPAQCPDPRFDVHELLDLAHDVAQEGPTPTPRVAPRPSSKCPEFSGPLWPAASN